MACGKKPYKVILMQSIFISYINKLFQAITAQVMAYRQFGYYTPYSHSGYEPSYKQSYYGQSKRATDYESYAELYCEPHLRSALSYGESSSYTTLEHSPTQSPGHTRDYVQHLAVKLPSKKIAVLLIGSTGNGKSTLGNYMLDPERQVKHFKTAKANKPETQNTQSKCTTLRGASIEDLGYSSIDLTVIDTPGLNESDAADVKHTTGMVENLKKLKEIAACILVIKFRTKIDAQYKRTIEYYAKHLPSIFEKNMFVVMTDYATDPRSVAIRKQEGIDAKQIEDNTKTEIVQCVGLSFSKKPMIFMLDCIPYGPDESKNSLSVRNAILKHILSYQQLKLTASVMAKTEHLLKKDSEQEKKYEARNCSSAKPLPKPKDRGWRAPMYY